MANVKRHDCFPTCIYQFTHNFKDNELEKMIKHIDDNSLSEHNGQVLKRTGSQIQTELHKIDIFQNVTKTIIETSKIIMEDQKYLGEIEITNSSSKIQTVYDLIKLNVRADFD